MGIMAGRKQFYTTLPGLENYENVPFIIYRLIPHTDKVGNQRESDLDDFVATTAPVVGLFVLDTRANARGDRQCQVRNIEPGTELNLLRRRLQLLHRPWGLPDRLPTAEIPQPGPVRPANVTPLVARASDSAAVVNAASTERGLTTRGNKATKYQALLDWEAQWTVQAPANPSKMENLPLFRVNVNIDRLTAASTFDFEEGEIVLVYGVKGRKRLVVDYKGNKGVLKPHELTAIADPFLVGQVDTQYLDDGT